MFELLRSDYNRHGKKILNPAFWALCNFRFGSWVLKIRFAPLRWLAMKIYGFIRFLLLITSCIELNLGATIGKDLHLIHSSNIHIHPKTIIGDRCGIMHDVTIGTNMDRKAPIIGNDVFIGAGAKVLGEIKIGDGATISANSLVTVNVPPHSVAIGVPARIIKGDRLNTLKVNISRRDE